MFLATNILDRLRESTARVARGLSAGIEAGKRSAQARHSAQSSPNATKRTWSTAAPDPVNDVECQYLAGNIYHFDED